MIAIDQNNRLYYEGTSNYGHGIWPSPVVTIATIIRSDDDRKTIPRGGDLMDAKMVFREDSFDPVTRIRRGRLYIASQTRPEPWYVQPHPAYPNEVWTSRDQQNRLIKSLFGFQIWNAPEDIRKHPSRVAIALGVSDAFTLWNAVDIERISTGEYMITLHARSSLGTLPDLNVESIPQAGRKQVLERLDKVAEAVRRAGPESVVDRCKDVAQSMLGLWMSVRCVDEKTREEDIGGLVKKMQLDVELKTKHVIINAANILARLHARAKPNEEVKRVSRPTNEADAECSVALVGMLVHEFGWSMDI